MLERAYDGRPRKKFTTPDPDLGHHINAQTLRVEPPLVVSYPQLDRFLSALDDSLVAVEKDFGL